MNVEERRELREKKKAELNEMFDKAWDGAEELVTSGAKAIFVASVVGSFIGGALGAGVVILLTR